MSNDSWCLCFCTTTYLVENKFQNVRGSEKAFFWTRGCSSLLFHHILVDKEPSDVDGVSVEGESASDHSQGLNAHEKELRTSCTRPNIDHLVVDVGSIYYRVGGPSPPPTWEEGAASCRRL